MGVRVDDNETFSLVDVYNAVKDHASPAGNLADCFDKAEQSYFNAGYKAQYYSQYGNKDNMLMFRDYGPNGIIASIIPGAFYDVGAVNNSAGHTSSGLLSVRDFPDFVNAHYATSEAMIGTSWDPDGPPQSTGISRPYMHFDIWQTIPSNAVITSAKLKFRAIAPLQSPARVYLTQENYADTENWDVAANTQGNIDNWTHWRHAIGNVYISGISWLWYEIDIPIAYMKDYPYLQKFALRENIYDYALQSGGFLPTDGWSMYALMNSDNASESYKPRLEIEYTV